jgi:hypothetical protein
MGWPHALAGAAAALTLAFTVSVGAQPARTAGQAARADAGAAGAGKSDAGALSAGADAGAAVSASADAGASGATTGGADAAVAVSADAGAGISAASSADAGASATDLTSSMPTTPIPTYRPHAPPLPPPTPEQLAGYDQLRQETEAYAAGARDYKDTITTIITLHYEEKKKSILGGLDNEIGIEKDELKKAREVAIQRLEAFIAKYSGPNAQKEATPDAMYRLAALYEERARGDDDPNSDMAVTLKPAIALYKRVIREYPDYRDIAGIYFFLGYALSDARRNDESQQVWRSLACHNHYAYPVGTDPKDPDIDKIVAMPQDRNETGWKEWRSKYTSPDSLKKGPKEETVFDDPYPTDCQPVVQPAGLPGDDPKYLAEIWWRIGDWEFDQFDLPGGVVANDPAFAVWDFNRAASAYTHSMQFKKKPTIFGIALYKHAWVEFKEQRYEAAVKEFVQLLNFTDEQEKLTGDPGADFRNEAFTYIAGSLDQSDFAGPSPSDPYITRPDILDTAKSPAEAEKALGVAIGRVQDPKLIPQDKPWTIEIYKALGLEFRTINQYKNALAVYQMTLEKWPMDPSAPQTQNAVAEVYDLLARQTKVGDERHEFEQKVLEARTALAKYIGDTPWVDANKDNPAAIQAAEELVRNGLKGAAIAHTKNGQGAEDLAGQLSDPKDQIRQLAYALSEYKLAAIGWLGYLKQDENAPDAYRSRYFYADALHQEVRLQVLLHGVDEKQFPEPTSQEIAVATKAAVDVRDSDEDDEFIDNAGLFVVDLSDVDRDLAFKRFADTGGTQGVEERKDIKTEGAPPKVVVSDIPPVILASMKARDEYIQHVPPERDRENHSRDYAFYSAEQYYLYGHFKDAEQRYQIIYSERCGKDPLGYEAWKKLIVMSNLQNNTQRSKELATAEKTKSCAITDLQRKEEEKGELTTAVLIDANYQDAHSAFEAAKNAPEGPEKNRLWEIAGKMYEQALRAAPAHKDAAEAAINSAYCYKQIGKFNEAIDLYNLFIKNYGSDELLTRLQKGGIDPETKQKVAANPEEYKTRIGYLGTAYDALSTTYYGFFSYQQAAESFGKIATNQRFDEDRRSKAANIALQLYSNLGDRTNMNRMYDILVDPKMKLDGDKRAQADYLKASFDYGQWNPTGGESAANSAARSQAITSLSQFHNAARGKPAAARYALEAAYRIAKMQEAAGDPGYKNWLHTIITDWEYFKNNPSSVTGADGAKVQVTAGTSPFNNYGGWADYTLVDEKIHTEFDYSTGHHKYKGTVVDVKKAVDKDLADLKKYQAELLRVKDTYKGEAQVSALARIGTLYDSVRTGLDLAAPTYVSPETSAKLAKFQKMADLLDSGKLKDADCQAQLHVACADAADKIQQAIDDTKDSLRTAWRQTKETYQKDITQEMVNDYAAAAVLARTLNLKDATVQNGVARLAYFTDYLGDSTMQAFVEAVPDPVNSGQKLHYTPGEFLHWRSGVLSTPPPNGQPAPLPAKP